MFQRNSLYTIMPPTYCCLRCEIAFSGTTKCPKCQQPMTNMGVNFRPPRKGKKNQWKKIRLLRSKGFRFTSCTCCRQWTPKTYSEAKRYPSK